MLQHVIEVLLGTFPVLGELILILLGLEDSASPVVNQTCDYWRMTSYPSVVSPLYVPRSMRSMYARLLPTLFVSSPAYRSFVTVGDKWNVE